VCKIPKPNKCENCACVIDPADPSKQMCADHRCSWGYYNVPGNPAKYASIQHLLAGVGEHDTNCWRARVRVVG
jgi:hypothetical protein